MTSQLSGAVTNIILDPILIFGLCGLPKMGVAGAAIATVIGQCVAAVVAFVCNLKYNHEVDLSLKGFCLSGSLIGNIYMVGIPSIIMQSIGSVMTYCMNKILIDFSSIATAVFGVYFKLQSFFFMPVFGLNNGITPIIAYSYGARQKNRMIKTIKLSMGIAFGLLLFGFVGFELVLHYSGNNFPGSWQSNLQYDCFHHEAVGGVDSGSVYSGKNRRTQCSLVGFPDCRVNVVRSIGSMPGKYL